MTRLGTSNTSIGGSVTIATSRPARAASTAWTAPASGRRVAPSRTRTANGGSRWSAARWRASDAMKSRRSLLDSPRHDDAADAHRPGPGQRLGIDPRPDDEDRAGRPDVEAARAQLAVDPGVEPAAGRPAEGDDAADAASGRADRDPGPRPDLADDPRERRLDGVGDVAAPRCASGRATRRRTHRRARARRRGAGGRSSAHRAGARRRRRAARPRRDAGRAAARRWAPRPRPSRRPRRAAGRPARARTARRPGR